jgi:hypothetical protein
MALKEKASAGWDELKRKVMDRKSRRKLQEEVRRRLREGRETIRRVEREMKNPGNRAKIEAKIKAAEAEWVRLKKEFRKKQEQAVTYTQKKPEKALAAAAAAGALVGALWAAFRRKP